MDSRIDLDILAGIDEIVSKEYPGISGIAATRDGDIIYERYFSGFGPADRRHVSSVTKSVLSALVGIALDEGFIRSVDDPVLDFFPDVRKGALAEIIGKARIRHLLSMTAPYKFEDWKEPFAELCGSADWALHILGSLGRGGEFGRFKYSSMGAHLLSCILSRAVGTSAREFANERLFAPLGIAELPGYPMEGFGYEELFGSGVRSWVSDPRDNSTGGWGLALSPREMASIGELYLGRGVWRGRRILSETWVDESLAPRSSVEIGGNKINYGYLWWLDGEDESGAFMALGDGGNAICCIPEKRAVVAITATTAPGAPDGWSFVRERILPALLD
jgi:CubicO group peptidase (beta-lactamase class C family)